MNIYSYTYIILSLDFEFSFKLNISVEFLSLNLVDFYFSPILIFWPAWPSKIAIARIEKALIVPKICLESFLSFHSLAAPSLSSVVTKLTPTATSAYFQREQTTSPPNLESTRSSILSASSIAALTAILSPTQVSCKRDLIGLKIVYFSKEKRRKYRGER